MIAHSIDCQTIETPHNFLSQDQIEIGYPTKEKELEEENQLKNSIATRKHQLVSPRSRQMLKQIKGCDNAWFTMR